MTYVEHCVFSLRLSCVFARAALCATVHALLPFLCVHSSSEAVRTATEMLTRAGCRDVVASPPTRAG